MENFIVSARKYRPVTFDTVIGQDNITSTLKNAIRNKQLAQAFLFTGPRGVGKTTCARILAKTINCMNLSDKLESCNKCESCISFNRSASFNVHELDAASNNSVDDIRNLVDQVRIPPQVGKYKVYIIDEVHMLSQSAFNAFLKTLEEPPEYAKFILATTEKHKIIPTILSRCQIYDFRRITVSDIIAYLRFVAEKEGVVAESLALNIIALKADGALRDALSMFDQLVSFAGKNLTYSLVHKSLNVLDYDYYFKIIGYLLNEDISNTMLIFNEIIESGFDGQHFIGGLGEHIRNLLVCKDKITVKLLEVGESIEDNYTQQAEKCPVKFLLELLNIIQKTDFNYKMSNNKRLHVEIALMQMTSVISEKKSKPCEIKQQPVIVDKKTEVSNKLSELPKPKPHSIPSVTKPTTPSEKKILQKSGSDDKDYFPGTISINEDTVVKENKEDIVREKSIDTNSDDFKNARTILPDELLAAWKEYAEKISYGQPILYSTLCNNKPQITDDFIITFEVKNSIQKTEIETKKSELLSFLREKLQNRFLRLEVKTNPDIKDARPYSPEEIFKAMAQKNPNLIKLKNNLGLEIEL